MGGGVGDGGVLQVSFNELVDRALVSRAVLEECRIAEIVSLWKKNSPQRGCWLLIEGESGICEPVRFNKNWTLQSKVNILFHFCSVLFSGVLKPPPFETSGSGRLVCGIVKVQNNAVGFPASWWGHGEPRFQCYLTPLGVAVAAFIEKDEQKIEKWKMKKKKQEEKGKERKSTQSLRCWANSAGYDIAF